MRFIDRKAFIENAQELVNDLFGGYGWSEVKFLRLSGNDFSVLCNGGYEFHAYIEDFMLRSFKKDLHASMVYMKGYNNTKKFTAFMTKLFGKEYVDAYEEYVCKCKRSEEEVEILEMLRSLLKE